MKKYIGLKVEQAIALAEKEERSHKWVEEEMLWVETEDGCGCVLYIEDGKVDEYEFCGWC